MTLMGLGKAVEHKAEVEAPAAEEKVPEPAPKKTTTRKRTKES